MKKKSVPQPPLVPNIWMRGALALEPPISFRTAVPRGADHALEIPTKEPSGLCSVALSHSGADIPGMSTVDALVVNAHFSLPKRRMSSVASCLEAFSNVGPPAGESLGIQEAVKRPSKVTVDMEAAGIAPTIRSIYDAIHSALNRVLSFVRDDCGQYWIETLPPYWEGRGLLGTVGEFFRTMKAEYSTDGTSWKPFLLPVERAPQNWHAIADLMSESDWDRLRQTPLDPSNLTLHLVSRARAALTNQDFRTAVITMVTAVEREIVQFVQRELRAKGVTLSDSDMTEMSKNYGLTLLLERLSPSLTDSEDVKRLLAEVKKAVVMRNALVHGKESSRDVPPALARQHVYACVGLLSSIVPAERAPRWTV